MPGGHQAVGKSQAGQRPMEWQKKRSLHQTIDCSGRGTFSTKQETWNPKELKWEIPPKSPFQLASFY